MPEKTINTVKFDEWQKLDLRVGKILAVEEIEGADKLYKLSVDLGNELGKRTIVAGIKPHYKKTHLKNKTCVIFTNLEPRTLKGVVSEGMLLAAVSQDKKGEEIVKILQPDSDIEPGSKIR